MQEPTHILAGVIIQRAVCWKPGHAILKRVIVAVLAFLSHGVLDKLSNFTYHPGKADFHSVVWVSYHSAVLVTTILFLYIWWRRFKWGIFFAMLPDLDWVFIHGQEFLHVRLPFYHTPYLHHLVGWTLAQIPGIDWLNHMPNNREQPSAAMWEMLIVAAMLILIGFITRKPPQPIQQGGNI